MLSGLFALVLFSLGVVGKVTYDARCLMDEVRHTVSANPGSLRTWVVTQFQKHPQGGDIPETVDIWPDRLKRRCKVYLAPSNEGMLRASLSWSFFLHTSTITVWVNPDGTPGEVSDDANLPPDRLWAKGISFTNIPR
jgi:hypothetical protein